MKTEMAANNPNAWKETLVNADYSNIIKAGLEKGTHEVADVIFEVLDVSVAGHYAVRALRRELQLKPHALHRHNRTAVSSPH